LLHGILMWFSVLLKEVFLQHYAENVKFVVLLLGRDLRVISQHERGYFFLGTE